MRPHPAPKTKIWMEDREMRRLAASLSIVVLLASCTAREGSSGAEPSPRESPSFAVSGCPNERAVVSDEANRLPGGLEGDVDGDGRSDTVWLATTGAGDPGCSLFLAVETAGGLLSTGIEEEDGGTAGPPALLGLYEIDGRPGNEIVVRLVVGASTEFSGLFSAADGRLTRVAVRGGDFGNLFPWGGSASHLEASDCAGEAAVVVTTASAQADRYVVKRRTFEFEGGELVFDSEASEREVVAARRLPEVPELASGAPFAACPTD